MKIRSVAAAKILSSSEKRGGAGGGSFRPLRRSSPEVRPAGLRLSSAHPRLRWREACSPCRTCSCGRGAAAPETSIWIVSGGSAPDLTTIGCETSVPSSCHAFSVCDPARDVVEAEGAVGPGDGREGGVDDHDEADHLGMDVAVDAHEPRLVEFLGFRGAAPVQAEVEAVASRDREDVVVDRVRVRKLDGRVDRHGDDVRLEPLGGALHLRPGLGPGPRHPLDPDDGVGGVVARFAVLNQDDLPRDRSRDGGRRDQQAEEGSRD